MPIAKVRLPDGSIGRFEVPEGTTPDQVIEFATQQGLGQRSQFDQASDRYKDGSFSDEQRAAFEEIASREGRDISTLSMGTSPFPPRTGIQTPRQQEMEELAKDTGFLEAMGASVGKGFMTVGRGVGLADPAGEIEQEAFGALAEERPITTAIGETIGEAAPFLPAAVATGGIAALAPRALATGAVTAAEGGILASGRGEDVLTAAGLGGGIGLGAEVLFPVLGKLGRKIFQRVTGKAPKGAMLDAAGNPSPEFQQALEADGTTFDEFKQETIDFITGQKPGANPEQVARKAMFEESGVPLTQGELTQDFGQQATEQRLLESAEDKAAEPLRQFKLKQSEAIKTNLQSNFGFDVDQEGTGQLIQDALTGRKKLLRTQKNELYETAAEKAEEFGGINLFTDSITEAIPDTKTMRRLSRRSGNQIEALEDLLVEFGITDNADAVKKFVDSGGYVQPLSVSNFEDFRQELNALMKTDQSGATSVAAGPIKNALDGEIKEIGPVLERAGAPSDIIETMEEARKTVRQIKTEFSPQSIVGKIIDTKKDGFTQVTEASKIYSKLSANASPVEETRRVVKSLLRSGEKGEQAVASLQASTMMDLIDGGFSTGSRKINDIEVFNPTAFKRRLDKIGPAKLKAIFSNNPEVLKKLNNIEKISRTLVPPSGTQPKGSASVILDLMDKMGWSALTAKFPPLTLVVGGLKKVAQPVKTGFKVDKALKAEPDVIEFRNMIDKSFPGLASAIGIAGTLEAQGDETP